MRKQGGFTLIEIAIVLVIIGLLIGGVLKGQELITSARVRNLISQQDGVRAAYFGFLDRFRAPPGDYSMASTNIANVAAGANGNGNGKIRSVADGDAIDEFIAVWDHLAKAGFINGSYTYAASPETAASAPTNPYARYLQMIFDDVYAGGLHRHNIKTGNQIPSEILAETDRKIDDGNPVGGVFRFSVYSGGTGASAGTAPTGGAAGQCYNGTSWATPSVANCGGASLL